MDKKSIIDTNIKRLQEINSPYNPISGEGSFSCERRVLHIADYKYPDVYLPVQMFSEPLINIIEEAGSFADAVKLYKARTKQAITLEDMSLAFISVRIKYDFEFWAFTTIKIKPKITTEATGDSIPFKLNRGQRKYLKYILDDWFNDRPIRLTLLKARQWGGSTLTQMFMMWIQLVHKMQWNSVICSHVENTARIIRGMYTKALAEYPFILDHYATEPLEMKPYEGSNKTRIVPSRGCRITIGSSERPEGLRGEDVSLAHFSEVASFATTDGKKPEDLIQSIVSGISYTPGTMIVYESTAKGVGNFFHRQCLDAKNHLSAFKLVFIAWYDIENYALPISDYDSFIESMTEDELKLFRNGATLENINWYRSKMGEISDRWRFVSEFPSNDIEAFQSTGSRFYNIEDVDRLRRTCRPPSLVGDVISDADYGEDALKNIKFMANPNGKFNIWELPDDTEMMGDRYIVVVDPNRGTSKSADNGIICVIDRYWMGEIEGGRPEVVAEWCGHIMLRYFIWIAVKIAKLYRNAHLVIESNTPDTAGQQGFVMDSIMDEIASFYDNMYFRDTPPEDIRGKKPTKWGFHMNRPNKMMICTHQQLVLANNMYIEHSIEAVDEHDTFETKDNGTLGAVDGCHDDRHITRALGVWLAYKLPPPIKIDQRYRSQNLINKSKVISEASF